MRTTQHELQVWADDNQDIHVVGTHDPTAAARAANDYERRLTDGDPWYLFGDRDTARLWWAIQVAEILMPVPHYVTGAVPVTTYGR